MDARPTPSCWTYENPPPSDVNNLSNISLTELFQKVLRGELPGKHKCGLRLMTGFAGRHFERHEGLRAGKSQMYSTSA